MQRRYGSVCLFTHEGNEDVTCMQEYMWNRCTKFIPKNVRIGIIKVMGKM